MDVGPAELIIVLLIVLLIFGGAKLPKLARSMGQAAHEFRKGLHLGADDDDAAADAEKAEKVDQSEKAAPEVSAGGRDAPSASSDA